MNRILLLPLSFIALSVLVFSDTWQETTTADFSAGAADNTSAISDSVQLSSNTNWLNPVTSPAWWDTNYQYRKAITIDNKNTSALSDYQIKVENPVYNETGLVGSWHFDYAVSGSIANGSAAGMSDSSGYSNNGAASNVNGTGMAWAAGKYNGAISFDGIDDYVTAGNAGVFNFERTNAFSISGWIKTTSTSVSVIGKMANSAPYTGYDIAIDPTGKFTIILVNTWSTNAIRVLSSQAINTGTWKFIAVTYDGSSSAGGIKMYIDGAEDTARTSDLNNLTATIQNSIPVTIGSRQASRYVNGSIDEMRIHNRPLTADEISALYTAKAKPNYDDVRFRNSIGTELPCWMEKDGTFWVKVAGTGAIPAGLSQIYLYYGNASAVSTSNGLATFDFFDDFNDGDSTGWNAASGAWSVSSQSYQETTDTPGNYLSYETQATYSNLIYEAKIKSDSAVGAGSFNVGLSFRVTNGNDYYDAIFHPDYSGPPAGAFRPEKCVGGVRSDILSNTAMPFTPLKNTWYAFKVIANGTNFSAYINNQLITSWTDSSQTTGYVGGFTTNGKGQFDDMRVRQYAPLEPNVYTGSEISQSSLWPYRKPISITNYSSSLSDYQAKVQPFSLPRYEETDPACAFSGTWTNYAAANHSNGAIKSSLTSGDYVVFSFTGTGAAWIGNKNYDRGIAKVYIDDIFQYDVDCYEPLAQYQLALFTKTGLTDTAHTLKLEVSNTKNTLSSNYYVSADAFEVYTSANDDFINNNGLAAGYHMSEGAGSFISDASGNSNTCVSASTALKTVYSITASGNSYAYIDLNSVSDYVIQAGDYVEYDVLWTSASDFVAFDYTCSDGTALRGTANDQNGLGAHPATNLSAAALNTWYHRKIAIPGGHTGKTIQYYDLASENDTTAVITSYFKNILITDGAGTTRKIIFDRGWFTYANHILASGSITSLTTGLTDAALMPAWTNGKFGKCLSFNGIDTYAEAPDSPSLDITHAITLEAWVKPSSYFNVWDNHIMNKEWDAYILYYSSAGIPGLSVYVDGGMRMANASGSPAPLGSWTHIAGTYDSSTHAIKIYVNGALKNTTTLTGLTTYLINTNNYAYRMGLYSPGKGVNGLVDEARVYNRALTDDEILARYNLHQSKLNGDYSDVRFASSNGIELPYWMETDKTFWVKLIDRDAFVSGASDMYLYYGNLSAQSVSNGNAVFNFFDDFNDNNYTLQWTNPAGTFTEANGYVQQTSDTGAAANEGTDELRSIAQIPASMASGGFVAQAGVYSGNSGSWNDIAGVIFTTQTATTLNFGTSSTDKLSLFNRYYSGADNGFGVSYKTGWLYTIGDSYLSGWNRISAAFKGAGGWELKGYGINDTVIGAGNGLNETVIAGPLYVRLHSYNNSTRWDNVFVRKYAVIEPSVSSAGTEETPYLTAGSFTSAVKDTAADDSLINSIAWSVSGAGTITMQIRANNSPLSWTSSSPAWENVTNGDTSITAKGRYLQYKATFTGNGASSNPALTDITVTYTAPVTPPTDSVSCDKLPNTWYSTAVFTFTNDTGFGTQINKYYYAWDNTSSYTFTLTEPVWNSSTPQLQNSSTSDGLWYFHYLPVSSTNTPGTAQDIGPYKYDGTAPAACMPLSPADNANIASSVTTFVWQGSSDTSGVTYTLQMDNYPDFSSPLINKTYITNTTYTLNGSGSEILTGNSTYYWRVLAVNGASNTSYMSNPSYYKFTTTSSVPQVTNESTGESFATLQDAIDSASTADNDTLTVNDNLTHNENISLTKNIILENAVLSPASGFAVTGQGALGGEILRNCVIASGGISDLALGENLTIFDAGSATPMVIENSRLVNCLIEFGTTLTNCTLENCDLAATAEYFVDAANGDFHLTGTASLAIDQGKNLSSEFTTDIDGIVRNKDILEINNFDSGAWDIGAYEYDPENVYINPTGSIIESSPSGLTYSTIEGSSADITKTLAISNAGTMDFDWVITDDAAWLTTTPSSGTGSTPTTVSVTTNPSGLSAGLYTAAITVTSAEASNSPLYVLVNLIVNSISSSGDNYALMEATPLALSFYELINTSSSVKTIVISNAGMLDFNWSITDDAEWLSVSPDTGIGSESTSAEATVTLTGLTDGSYSANITITAEGALNNPLTIPVSLTIYETSDNSNNSGNTGTGGSNSNMSGTIPSSPLLYSPSKGLSNVYPAPVLTWAPVAGSASSVSYWLQISTNAEFSNMLINKIIYSTSYQTTNVEFGKVYYWRVKAANSAGMSNWSETWEFQMSGQNEQTGGTNTKACFITKLKIKN